MKKYFSLSMIFIFSLSFIFSACYSGFAVRRHNVYGYGYKRPVPARFKENKPPKAESNGIVESDGQQNTYRPPTTCGMQPTTTNGSQNQCVFYTEHFKIYSEHPKAENGLALNKTTMDNIMNTLVVEEFMDKEIAVEIAPALFNAFKCGGTIYIAYKKSASYFQDIILFDFDPNRHTLYCYTMDFQWQLDFYLSLNNQFKDYDVYDISNDHQDRKSAYEGQEHLLYVCNVTLHGLKITLVNEFNQKYYAEIANDECVSFELVSQRARVIVSDNSGKIIAEANFDTTKELKLSVTKNKSSYSIIRN